MFWFEKFQIAKNKFYTKDDEMFHLCDWEDRWSHLSVPLARSHLKADLGRFGKMEM